MNCYVDRPVGRGGKWSIMGAVQGRLKLHDRSWAEVRRKPRALQAATIEGFILMDNKEIHVQLSHSPGRSG